MLVVQDIAGMFAFFAHKYAQVDAAQVEWLSLCPAKLEIACKIPAMLGNFLHPIPADTTTKSMHVMFALTPGQLSL